MSSIKETMGSKGVVTFVKIGTTILLIVMFVACGFLACRAPVSTNFIANRTVNVNVSPFSHDDLVKGANATRDYSFAKHDLHDLYATIYEMNQSLVSANSSYANSAKAPKIDVTVDPWSLSTEELAASFSGASDTRALDEEAISHLDDVYNIAKAAYIAIAVVLVLLIAGMAHVIYYRKWRGTWKIFVVAGVIPLVLFIIMGIAAWIDFYSFFAFFHSFFFTGDSWVFNYDSLLICMLPQNFWIGMGALWLGMTSFLSVISIVIGLVTRKFAK